jgi:hypothetical protein
MTVSSDIQGAFAVCLRVEEFRNGQKIAEVFKEISVFNLDSCDNTVPIASGMDSRPDFDTIVCPGQTLCFEVVIQDPDSQAYTLEWLNPISQSQLIPIPGPGPDSTFQFCWTPTSSDVGTHTLTLTLRDSSCEYTAMNYYEYQIHVAFASILAADVTLCQNATQLSPSYSMVFNTYQWTPSSGLSDPTAAFPIALPGPSMSYTINASSGVCAASDVMTVTWAIIQTEDDSTCYNIPITLSATYSTTFSSFIWQPYTGLSNPLVANPVANPQSTIVYTLSATAGGCTAVDSLTLTIFNVDVGVIQVLQTLAATANGALYQWGRCDFGFTPIPGATNQAFVATSNGLYAVEVTQNGCVDTSQCYLITGLGIAPDADLNLSAYPNPSSGAIAVDVGNTAGELTIEVTDLSGRIISTYRPAASTSTEVILAGHPGIYVIAVRSDQGIARLKVVKQ